MVGCSRSCCVPNCDKSYPDNVILHSFPKPDTEKERFTTWMNAVGSSLSSLSHDFIYKNRKICHNHFEERYLTWTRRLCRGAVPTVNLPERQVCDNGTNIESAEDDPDPDPLSISNCLKTDDDSIPSTSPDVKPTTKAEEIEPIEFVVTEIEAVPRDKNYWARKVNEIVLNKRFCGICLNFDEEMSDINDNFHIDLNGKTFSRPLKEIVHAVLKTNLANTEICSNCTSILLESYIFIMNAKQKLRTLNYHLSTIFEKTFAPPSDSLKKVVISLKDIDDEINIDDGDSTDDLETKKLSGKCLTCSENLTNVDSHQCIFSCIDCKTVPCIHHKYLKSYRDQILSLENETKCLDCEYVYTSKDDLIKHVNLKHLNNGPNCDKCGQRLYIKPEQDHTSSVNETKDNNVDCDQNKERKDYFNCNVCKSTFKNKNALLLHMEDHERGKTYQCCNTQYETLFEYKQHCRKHLSPFVVCKICRKEVRRYLLKEHIQTHKDDRKIEKAVCESCGKIFETTWLLYCHQRTHINRVKCPKCNKLISPSKLTQHLRVHIMKENAALRDGLIKCEHCQYRTAFAHMLETHVNRRHLKIKPYKCDICKKCFIGKQLLIKHLRTHIDKVVICYVCGKKLANSVSFKLHMRLHTNERPFGCELCGKRFTSSSLKAKHKRKHSEKNCACPICAKKFYTFAEVRSHVKKVHWKNKDKKFDYRELEGLSEEHYYIFQDARRSKENDREILKEN